MVSTCIPDHIWAACFQCAVGTLPDGTIAKMPLAPVLMHDMADPETFAIKVAALLRHFHQLTADICDEFTRILNCAYVRSRSILKADTSIVPGFSRSAYMEHAEVEPHVWGEMVALRYLKSAKKHTVDLYDRSFCSLPLDNKALMLYSCPHPDMMTPSSMTQEQKHQLRTSIETVKKNCEDLGLHFVVGSNSIPEASGIHSMLKEASMCETADIDSSIAKRRRVE